MIGGLILTKYSKLLRLILCGFFMVFLNFVLSKLKEWKELKKAIRNKLTRLVHLKKPTEENYRDTKI